jgi:hypothetical protein
MAELQTTSQPQEPREELLKFVNTNLEKGVQEKFIVKQLIKKKGMSETEAKLLVQEAVRTIEEYKQTPQGRQEMVRKYKRKMVSGFLWAAGGTIVTVATYSAASDGGGTYVIAWGAILFGIIDFFRGLFGWMKYKGTMTEPPIPRM